MLYSGRRIWLLLRLTAKDVVSSEFVGREDEVAINAGGTMAMR
jgi:hypothetical protein